MGGRDAEIPCPSQELTSCLLIVTKRLQRQRLQMRLLFGEYRCHLPLDATVDALIGPVLFPVVQIRVR